MIATLPVLMALSWVPITSQQQTPAPTKAEQPVTQAAETMTCPLTGQEIPACCCPIKK